MPDDNRPDLEQHDEIVMINVFTIEAQHQERLVDLLAEVTERHTSRRAGFLGSEFHVSLDGTRFVNCARWASRDAHEAIFDDPEMVAELEQMKEKMRFASADPHLYVVRRRIAPRR